MGKFDILINIINITFSIINLILSIILESQKNSFNSVTKTTLVRYRYFEDVLINPYFKLIITSFCYDIFYYSGKYFLKNFFFKVNLEKNEENVRTKSIQENMVSNIIVEFLFMTMIKGLALGFGIFYIYEIDSEIKRIIRVRDINDSQEMVLNSMISIAIICGVFDFLTIIYQFIFFGIRLVAASISKKSYYNNKDKNEKNINKGIKRVNSEGNISLPESHETNEEMVNYEKLEQ
jgi:hypothetical protein